MRDAITFALDVDGIHNWVGLGISEAGGMLAADMAIVRRGGGPGGSSSGSSSTSSTSSAGADGGAGEWWAGDYWSMDFVMPQLDHDDNEAGGGAGGGAAAAQNVRLLSAGVEAAGGGAGGGLGATTVSFWRPLDTCDEVQDRRIIRGTAQYLIYAYGTAWAQHDTAHRGNVLLTLLPQLPAPAPAPAAAMLPDIGSARASDSSGGGGSTGGGAGAGSSTGSGMGSSSWEVRMANVTVPAAATSYLCRHLPVPNPGQKVQAVSWDVLLTPPAPPPPPSGQQPAAAAPLVHHMIIYACTQPPPAPSELFECPVMADSCEVVYMVWVPGVTHWEAPAEAGYAFGGAGGVTWVALQVHYSNPDGVEGVRDSSGLVLHTTPQLRPHDIGVLALGPLVFYIPPGNASWTLDPASICPSGCTKQLPGPVTLVYSGFHMHTLGRHIRTQWIRNGSELQPLGERRAWSFDYQGATYVDAAANSLSPGDSLVTTCTWDSTGREGTTRFGYSTADEMCFNFVVYYPRHAPLEMCATANVHLMPGRPRTNMAVCSSMSKAIRLFEALNNIGLTNNSANATKALASLTAQMLLSGELMSADLPPFTPYSPTCSPVAFNSSTQRGSGGHSGGGNGGGSGGGSQPRPHHAAAATSRPPSAAARRPPPQLAARRPPKWKEMKRG
ncbi:hypothetical protein HXX76_009777 [Chlamydomonas incerta]|uniref:DOMON domain-containing protein n=1 Tax=Chlamydomonas incerta TaxID=51695 RepID=A0A835SS26_CHLIN|nr:hypothetical protein HXX76_009777 [Chlamydomonas incerta]|eukprot:KAG2430801.1 hypothetical protein HXX76_009777 [Chlamydomonas incerta]